MKIITFQRYKNWNFICHVCVSQELTTVEKNVLVYLNSGEIYMMFYAIVIIQIGYYPVSIIKYNHNIMVQIVMYLFKVLPYITSVCHAIPVNCWHQIMWHVMLSFFFCLIIANSMPQPRPHTVNTLLNCCKTEQYYFLT